MDTHLIVAVHGIGEQRPGETVNAIVGAATTQFEKDDPLFLPVTIEGDVVDLADNRLQEQPRNGTFFPSHLRTIKAAQAHTPEERAVFAEVFWADKSPAPHGAFWTIFDLLKIVLGLGYLAMENAESNRGRYSVWLVRFFIWTFFCFVAPINATLLISALFLLLEATPLWSESVYKYFPILFLGHALLTIGIGLYIRFSAAKTHLMRLFGSGLISVGIVFLLVLWLSIFFDGVNTLLCNGTDTQSIAIANNIDCYFSFILWLMEISWLGIILLALAISVIGMVGAMFGLSSADANHEESVAARIRDAVTGVRIIYPSICAAMVIFWSVIASSLWLFLFNVARGLSHEVEARSSEASQNDQSGDAPAESAAPTPDSVLLDPVTTGQPVEDPNKVTGLLFALLEEKFLLVNLSSSFALVAAVILVIVLAALIVIRKTRAKLLFQKAEWRSRLILNPIIRYLLVVGLAIVALGLALPFFENTEDSCADSALQAISTCWMNSQKPFFAAFLLLLGIVLFRFSHQISGGLGIFRDIVTYSVQESCAWTQDPEKRAKNFTQRDQINARFRRTLHYGLEAFQPTRVTIIAHSLGSIIATRMLHDRDVKALLAKNGNPEVVLITMGSPATHIYRRYFKEFFQISTDDMPLAETPGAPVNKAWYNIHREDDFVGTRIGDDIEKDTPDLAQNFSVQAGGHTGYFTDGHVWKVLRDQIGFRLFPSQFMTERREAAE
ncbi:hypothetical protein [Gymnodinialimonas hymeniacidonis]|uniref:hypothetical protein n=1 Tax=Gymnodinialimonas hymeniacidonis TaxID=3126508 RepID=UPI0034C66EDD